MTWGCTVPVDHLVPTCSVIYIMACSVAYIQTYILTYIMTVFIADTEADHSGKTDGSVFLTADKSQAKYTFVPETRCVHALYILNILIGVICHLFGSFYFPFTSCSFFYLYSCCSLYLSSCCSFYLSSWSFFYLSSCCFFYLSSWCFFFLGCVRVCVLFC